jgi:hypothetical protein
LTITEKHPVHQTTLKNRRNYYRILQVQPDAPSEIIHASYRTIMRELKQHPDLGGDTSDAALLNEAYETLKNPLQRASYDEELFRRFTRQSSVNVKQLIAPILCPICKRPISRVPEPGELCENCRTPLQSIVPRPQTKTHKRAIERTKSSEIITYYSSWPGKAGQGRMIDFSPNGMRFVCNETLKPQIVLKISSKLFEASGAVTNASEEIAEGKKYYAIGICFIAVNFKESRGTFFSTSA